MLLTLQELILQTGETSLPEPRPGALPHLTRLRIFGSPRLRQLQPSWCALPSLLVSGGLLPAARLCASCSSRAGWAAGPLLLLFCALFWLVQLVGMPSMPLTPHYQITLPKFTHS